MADQVSAALRRHLLALPLFLMATDPLGAQPAFPGAFGYGQDANGWRGGTIIAVTSLEDEGPGTLRACAEAEGPRVCVFRVGGTITVSRPIFVASQVYIAGQTAPGDGVQLRTDGATLGPLIIKNAEDVVVRFLRSRPGPSAEPSPTVSAVLIENARHIYLDHLSMAFATDQTLTIHASAGLTADITVANSLLAFSLDRSSHPKGRHSKGAQICSSDAAATGCGRVTLWRNLFAHHRDRNPDVNATDTGPVEVVNNVFYDPISQFGEYYNISGNARIAHVGNVTMPGPSTIDDTPPAVEVFLLAEDHTVEVTARDNLAFANRPCRNRRLAEVLGPQAQDVATDGVELSPGLPVILADELADVVLATAGDVLHRDALDELAIANVQGCTGSVIDSPSEVGGWPELELASGPPDKDDDGLPDDWELSRADLDPAHPDDPWLVDPTSGLSRIETYLSTLASDI